jgi:hypothetical protein
MARAESRGGLRSTPVADQAPKRLRSLLTGRPIALREASFPVVRRAMEVSISEYRTVYVRGSDRSFKRGRDNSWKVFA